MKHLKSTGGVSAAMPLDRPPTLGGPARRGPLFSIFFPGSAAFARNNSFCWPVFRLPAGMPKWVPLKHLSSWNEGKEAARAETDNGGNPWRIWHVKGGSSIKRGQTWTCGAHTSCKVELRLVQTEAVEFCLMRSDHDVKHAKGDAASAKR